MDRYVTVTPATKRKTFSSSSSESTPKKIDTRTTPNSMNSNQETQPKSSNIEDMLRAYREDDAPSWFQTFVKQNHKD